MAYRNLYIKKAKKLSILNSNLKIIKENDQELLVPIEDISYILLEDPTTIITARALATFSKNYIVLVTCDENYMPVTLSLPLNQHHKLLSVFKDQLQLSREVKSCMWQSIIKSKVENQMKTLTLTSKDKGAIELLESYIDNIQPNDMSNIEAIAAKIYFNSLFGEKFKRTKDSKLNMALNYGYSILIAQILRTLYSFGITSMLGIWHDSATNNFNLAYDIIEPFRPIVDYFLFWNMEKIEFPLSSSMRQNLVKILEANVEIKNKKYKVSFAIELVTKSYLQSIQKNENELVLPNIIFNDFIIYE